MSERKKTISKILASCLTVQEEPPSEGSGYKINGIDEAARRIAALPQQITAETVRRVLEAFADYVGSIGDMPAIDHEAIAHRANQRVSHEG